MKTGIIFLLCGFLAMNCHSQNLAPFPAPGFIQGNLYNYGLNLKNYRSAVTEYIGDTVMRGYNYHQFKGTFGSNNYARYDQGKVFKILLYSNGTFSDEILLYDFTLSLNDSFNLIPRPYYTDSTFFKVDSVGSITLLNGETRKYMELIYGGYRFRWIDGIGDVDHGFFYYFGAEGEHSVFTCHRDYTGLVYINPKNSWDCDSIIGFENPPISGTQSLDAKIFYKPGSQIVKINVEEPGIPDFNVQVFNILGQIIDQIPIDIWSGMEYEINLSDYPKGPYIIRLDDGQTSISRKIIKY